MRYFFIALIAVVATVWIARTVSSVDQPLTKIALALKAQ